ncbi:histone-lysine N-methyltransferase SETMAR-like [Ptiloglossa arizonensis]|uniref:histone-lysine N-methyltransferase SETMAR-like n=1 Tax=Ptiloglossa arizonensis TaxID=3350558 RepID=UPI003F9EFB4D
MKNGSHTRIGEKDGALSADWKEILHYELFPSGQLHNSDLYCQQLIRSKQAIDEKCPESANRKGVVFHQDNARPYTSLTTYQKLRKLRWEVISHPPYSLDLVPSDYHLPKHLQNFLHGIMKLPSKWRKVIEQNWAY